MRRADSRPDRKQPEQIQRSPRAREGTLGNRFPFGIPTGWFCVATSQEVGPASLITRRYFDREIVIFRTGDGALSVVDAHCPHMGAHLGKVGRVEGNFLRCGFHGFVYDSNGNCVDTAYDSPPPAKCSLSRWEVREQNGFVFAWFDEKGRRPDWETPVLDPVGWSRPRWKRYRIATHPQETTENSVDFGHFTKLHGFVDGSISEPILTQGPILTSSYLAHRPYGVPGRTLVKVPVEYHVTAAGLGYSQVEIEIRWLRFNIRVWVLSTPIDDEHVDLTLGLAVEKKLGPLMPIARRIGHGILCAEVEQDLAVWEHKIFMDPPQLAKGDGPIVAYRRWAKQFYSPTSQVSSPTE
jgi:nitrite reductase/ring-hydroxylating ferredoxin subunit